MNNFYQKNKRINIDHKESEVCAYTHTHTSIYKYIHMHKKEDTNSKNKYLLLFSLIEQSTLFDNSN